MSRTLPVGMAMVLVVLATTVLAGGSLFIIDNGAALPIRWDDRMLPVSFVMSSQGYAGSGISNNQLATEISAAISQINSLQVSRLSLIYAGEIDNNDSGGESILGAGIDGINLITFHDPDLSFGPGVAAVCAQTVAAAELVVDDSNNDLNGDGVADLVNGIYPAGTILDADVVFNGNMALDISGADGSADVQSLALHEIGHCIGLSHSVVRDAVMYPFQSSNVADSRSLKSDDIAYIADSYPSAPDYASSYGTIEGQVLSGVTGLPVVGAHVFAEDAVSRVAVVGSFTGIDGNYRIPVPSGDYVVGIEPLDGDPIGLDPGRINTLIEFTTDVLFPDEYFDSSESSVDVPSDVEIVPVAAGTVAFGIDLTTNVLDVLTSSLLVQRGINLFSYPVSVPVGISSFDLLLELSQRAGINSIQHLNAATGRFETAHLVDGIPAGYDFPIVRSAGYIVHSTADELLQFAGSPDCPVFDLLQGTSLIAAPCAPAEYSAFDLLQDLGGPLDVIAVQAYDASQGVWVSAAYSGADPAGTDFPVVDGGAYLVDLSSAITGFKINKNNATFPPVLLSASPGESVPGGIVTLKGTGFSVDPTLNVALFNEVPAEILSNTTQQLVVKVPLAATSGSVQVFSLGAASNALPFVVLAANISEIEGQINSIASGQIISATITDPSDVDDFRFLAIEGNRITAQVRTATPGVPELQVSLLNPLGGTLTVTSNGRGSVANISSFEAPETGFYTVSIRSLAGSGPYTLELTLEGSPGEPRLIAIQGDYQSGVMGTELPVPLQIVAVDETGLPASAVPISFAVARLGQQTSASLSTTTTADALRAMTTGNMTTLTSGVITVAVQLPDEETGDFEITVTAPFRTARPIKLLVSAIAKPISSVEVTPATIYACLDGSGCVVGEEVDIPYELVFKDVDGNAIENVFVEIAVISGAGKVAKTSGGPWEDKIRVESDVQGRVEAFHQLGEAMFFPDLTGSNDPTSSNFDPFQMQIAMPQQVAMTVPGQPFPVIFEARPKAAAPATIRSLRAQNQRASMGAASLGLFAFHVTDQFGNPVANAPVSTFPPPPGVFLVPGFLRGEIFSNNETDADGFWSAGFGIRDDGSLVSPSINEFREVITPPLGTVFTVGSATIVYLVDIDMGPHILSETIGAHALIGKLIADPVAVQVRRFQRQDTFIPIGNDDEDSGNWEDEDFSRVREIVFVDLPVAVSSRRYDGLTAAMQRDGIPTTTIDNAATWDGITAEFGRLTIPNIRVGGLFGGSSLILDIGTQNIEYFRDGEFSPYRTETFEFAQGNMPILADPLILKIDLEDPLPADPAGQRTYPGVSLASGIDVDRLGIKLNGNAIESVGLIGPAGYPNFATLTWDGISAAQHAAEGLRPNQVRLIYHPTSDQLLSGQPNQVLIERFFDGVEHTGVAADPADDTDQAADTITFEFNY